MNIVTLPAISASYVLYVVYTSYVATINVEYETLLNTVACSYYTVK